MLITSAVSVLATKAAALPQHSIGRLAGLTKPSANLVWSAAAQPQLWRGEFVRHQWPYKLVCHANHFGRVGSRYESCGFAAALHRPFGGTNQAERELSLECCGAAAALAGRIRSAPMAVQTSLPC